MTAGLATTWRAVEQVMGMPVSIALRGVHAGGRVGLGAWERVLDDLRDVDAVFSTYRADSVVSRLDRGEIDLFDCPPEVAEVLALAEVAETESAGAFTVWRPRPDGRVALDLDGVVKGWAVQRAARHLRALDGTDHCLAAGGDLVCWVSDARDGEHQPWQIGIEDPLDPTRLVARVPVSRGAVATSGTAHRGAHVLDGRTGLPAHGLASVTVLAHDLTTADVDATAAFALGADAPAWLCGRPGRSGLVVHTDGTLEVFG